MGIRASAMLRSCVTATALSRFERFTEPSANGRYLRIPAEDLSRRRFGSGGAVKGVGAYTGEVRGSNPLRSTR